MKHSKFYSAVYRRIEHYCLKRCGKIIAVDNATRNEYKQHFPTISGKIYVLPTGLNLSQFRPEQKKPLRKKYHLPPDAIIILYVGRLEEEKRIELLLQTFYELTKDDEVKKRQMYLLLVGDGRFRARLEKQAADLDLKNINFMGAKPHHTIPDLMNCGDVFVLLSKFEGSPTVIKEALACGLPVIATKVGNIPELVLPGKTGELVEINANPAEIAGKIQKVIKSLDDNTITRDACISIVKPFSWKKIADKMVGFYNDV
jgi:glycosyltransferase involved in cell wall biosynthesis